MSASPEALLERRLSTEASRRNARRLLLPFFVGVPFLLTWQWFTDGLANPLVPGPLQVANAVPSVVSDHDVWAGLASSDLSLVLGFAIAVAVGVPLGLLCGRVRAVDALVGPVLDLALVTPMIVVMPIVLAALGLTRESQVVIIFIFAITVVAVPVRAGMRAIPRRLVDMGHSFGASELQLWREILLPGSLPSIVTGLRIGFGQANLGMAAVELTMVALGIGNVILDLQSSFRRPEEWAVIGLIILQSIAIMTLLRAAEAVLTPSGPSVGSLEAGLA